MIYYLNPLYKAGAITDKDIDSFESDLIKEQFGLDGDNSNQKIFFMMSFYKKSTASFNCANCSLLRLKIKKSYRAKPKKHCIEKKPLTVDEKWRKKEK